MKFVGYIPEPVLVVGDKKLTFSLAVCLLQAGHPVTLCTKDESRALETINAHWSDVREFQPANVPPHPDFRVVSQMNARSEEQLVVVIASENVAEKKAVLQQVEKKLSPDAIIAINTESIPLYVLRQDALHQERIIGANWVEPVHTTFFLEIITDERTSGNGANKLCALAKDHWKKDPYVLSNGMGIRTRMMCAMLREAFYLIKEGYVTPEDIDRSCRNDPGYYLPFAGNFRYMDLMGTYIYGVVMQDLNPDLSKDQNVPEFFNELVEKGHFGMESGKGFFEYKEGEAKDWQAISRRFSYQIQEIIGKYPFNYQEEILASK